MATESTIVTSGAEGLAEWSSPSDLAEWLHVPLPTIYDWRRKGVGPPGHKVGRHVRYRRGDVEAWLALEAAS